MSFFLILFLVSLVGITFLISRKILLRTEGSEIVKDNFLAQCMDLEKAKTALIKNVKRLLHILIWFILRSYLIFIHLVKNKIRDIKNKIKIEIKKRMDHSKKGLPNSEPSKYLKVISEYQQKIKRLKHRIKEEEGLK